MDLQKQSSWLEFVWVFLEQHFDRFFLLSSKCCPCAQGFLLQTPNLLSIQERIPEMFPTTASHSFKNRRPALPHLLDMLLVWPVSKRIESVFGWCPCHRLYGQSRDHDPRGVCGFFRRFSRCVFASVLCGLRHQIMITWRQRRPKAEANKRRSGSTSLLGRIIFYYGYLFLCGGDRDIENGGFSGNRGRCIHFKSSLGRITSSSPVHPVLVPTWNRLRKLFLKWFRFLSGLKAQKI